MSVAERSAAYDAVLRLVRERTGLTFPQARRADAAVGVRRAMGRTGLRDARQYLERLAQEPAALDELVAELTVGETYFFREPEQLDFVRREVIPQLGRGRPSGVPLRAWSAGCASGEEAYTLAILLHEAGVAPARVVGTDVSRHRLAGARRARYTRWSLRGVPERVVARYFRPLGKTLELDPELRGRVDFGYLNLAEDVYPSLSTGIWGMDLILCRNVLIYLDRLVVAQVAQRLLDSLSADGWLFLGASDPALSDLVPCDVVVTGAGIAYRRPGTLRPAAPKATAAAPGPPLATPPAARAPEPPPTPARRAAAPGRAASDHYAARDYAAAAQHARQQLESGAADEATWVLLVRSLANRGELEEAGRACAAGLDRYRASAELLYLHAVLLAEAGRFAEAAAAARRALYVDRGLIVGHLALARALVRLREADDARRTLRSAERLLGSMLPEEVVPCSDGEPAGRLVEMARMQLRLLEGLS